MPKPNTPDWENMLLGVLFAPPADQKGWAAILREADEGRDMTGREFVIKQMIEHGRKVRKG